MSDTAAKVLAVLAIYSEAGSVREARKKVGLHAADFYGAINSTPALMAEYEKIKRARADMNVDMAGEIAAGLLVDRTTDPRHARVAIDGFIKIAALYDRDRFGDKLDVSVDQQISISGALAEALARRSNSPLRDLTQSANRQAIDAPYIMLPNAPDKQSEAPARPLPDFFED